MKNFVEVKNSEIKKVLNFWMKRILCLIERSDMF